MLNKLISLAIIAALSIAAIAVIAQDTDANDEEAIKIFNDNKCMMCHSIESKEIEAKKKKAFDLSNTGSNADLETMKLYLKKEAEIGGKKHALAFKGSDEELEKLAAWLVTLKTEDAPAAE
jgi:cytochrome c553